MPRNSIIFVSLLFALLLCGTLTQEPTILSYLFEYQEQKRQDFVELTVTTTASSISLSEAITQAKQKALKIKTVEQNVCRSLSKDKSLCKQSVQVGKVQIQPKYQTNKKQTTFQSISATYQILITVRNPEYFGQLVDQILTLEGFVIEKIEWKPDDDQEETNFLSESLEKSKQMCSQLGLTFKRLVAVEEVRPEPEQPEEEQAPAEGEEQEQEQEEEEQQEQPEEEEDITVYRITVECAKKEKSKKK